MKKLILIIIASGIANLVLIYSFNDLNKQNLRLIQRIDREQAESIRLYFQGKADEANSEIQKSNARLNLYLNFCIDHYNGGMCEQTKKDLFKQ